MLLLVMVAALAYLLRTTTIVTRLPVRAVAAALDTARARTANWLARWRPGGTATSTPPAAPASPATNRFSRAIRQSRQTVAGVKAAREALPPELVPRPAATTAAPSAVEIPADHRGLPRATTAPVATTASVATVVTPAPAAIAATAVTAAPPATAQPPPVVWPDVEVAAVVGSGRRGTAIVNGEVLVVGEESTEGLVLERIEPQAAVLRFQGETRRFIVRKR